MVGLSRGMLPVVGLSKDMLPMSLGWASTCYIYVWTKQGHAPYMVGLSKGMLPMSLG